MKKPRKPKFPRKPKSKSLEALESWARRCQEIKTRYMEKFNAWKKEDNRARALILIGTNAKRLEKKKAKNEKV